MGTHPTFAPTTGPATSYSPKTTDESDSSLGGTVVPHVNVQQASGATPIAVSGQVAVGAAPISAPLSVAGVDGGGLKRHVLLDTDGTTVTRVRGAGVGALTAVPAGSTNGTALGTLPATAKGARLYLPTGASVTYTIAASAPGSAPSATFTVSASTTGPNWDEDLSGQMIYVTAVSGSPLFRWY
jgi:hypothetical protein